MEVRVTGILVEDQALLLVKQRVTDERAWSLPGGRVETGETLEQALVRELKEETGLDVAVTRLLYLCERADSVRQLLHVTLELRRTDGDVTLPTNEHDENVITDVRFVPIDDLTSYGFTERFALLAATGFPGAGSYVGPKSAIGL